jgi:hypothetical protein
MNEFSTYEFAVSQRIEGKWRAARIGMIALYVCFVLGGLALILSIGKIFLPLFVYILNI